MPRRTLVRRMAVVHVITMTLALAGVLALSAALVTHQVDRMRDRALMNAASATVADLSELSDDAGPRRIARELDQHRAAGMRVEALDERDERVATAGEGPRLRPAGDDACADQAGWRVCERSVGALRVLVGRSRREDDRIRNELFFVLTLVSGGVLAVGALASGALAVRGLRPLSRMSQRLAELQPGAGERLGTTGGALEVDRLAGRFDELLARVDEAVARERRFAAQASHELRTPLTVLRGELEELAQDPLPSRLGIGRALESADRLVHLVESLLVLGRAESRFAPGDLEVVNLADVVRRETNRLRTELASRSLSVDLPDEVLVRGDDNLLGRTVFNLLDNAIKYSPAGSPLELSIEEPGSAVLLRVRDYGPGVPEELHERIFEPFFRDPAMRATRPGHGLGLALSRAVARAHGGDVQWVAAPGPGTTFELRLPGVL